VSTLQRDLDHLYIKCTDEELLLDFFDVPGAFQHAWRVHEEEWQRSMAYWRAMQERVAMQTRFDVVAAERKARKLAKRKLRRQASEGGEERKEVECS